MAEQGAPDTEDGLFRGRIVWASLNPTRGREQNGHRPVLVIVSDDYLRTVTSLVVVLPLTTADRGWPNHVPVTGATGLPGPIWALTEQPRTIARTRIIGLGGIADAGTLARVDTYLRDFLGV